MGKRMVLLMAVALAAAMIIPAVVFAAPLINPGLTNDYGQHFAGQDSCLGCHTSNYGNTVHGRFTKAGLVPAPPASWTVFQSLGGGPSYNILGNTWLTLGTSADAGADEGGSPSEILIWKGATEVSAPFSMPWNLVEGLSADPATGEYKIPAEGLSDGPYGCYQCHNLGPTKPGTGFLTASKSWSRPVGTTAADFATNPAVSQPGMSIQCESCHGTGVAADASAGGHFNTGTKLSAGNPNAAFNIEVLGNSQVCGACHASYTNTGPLGIFGYTADKRLADFVNVSGTPAGRAPYTKIPTEAEFLASPLAYSMFPNGDNATGHHFYYNEWQASAHSWRGALTTDSADASAYQQLGTSHYSNSFDPTLSSGCYKCHTGEGYLTSKNATVAKYMPSPAASNVGLMGQECITCHTGHPAGTDPANAGVMRAPDPAGVRSNTGRTTANASICEDCHNWQYETQGLATPGSAGFNYAPVANLTGHTPSHPQRETLHGRSMVEIAPASEFMPNAKCEDCHMPVTNSEDNRFAHGMKPMLPGDAQAWNAAANAASVAAGKAPVYEGKDSCTKCHPGLTADQLQAKVNDGQGGGWQNVAKDEAAKVATAITAAQTASEFSMTDSSKPGYVLVGRATWNYMVWQQDSSGSVHNPPYVMAGLQKAEQLAMSVGGKFAFFGGSASILPGGTGFVSGKVVNGDGSGAAGAMIKLSTGVTTTADAQGGFTFIVTQDVATSYTATWQRSSVASTYLTSAKITVAQAKFSSKTTIKASKTRIKLHKSVKISGKVTSHGKISGSVIIKYRKGTSGAWRSAKKISTTGSYAKSFRPGRKGSWYYKASYSGTSTVASSSTRTVKVKVK